MIPTLQPINLSSHKAALTALFLSYQLFGAKCTLEQIEFKKTALKLISEFNDNEIYFEQDIKLNDLCLFSFDFSKNSN